MISAAMLAEATIEHLYLTYGAMAVSIIIGIPLAVACLKNNVMASIILSFANLIQAIPSFAVVAIVVPLLGIGFTPAIVAIVLRTLLPIIKNTYIGLTEISPAEIESARGMGMTQWQILRYIRLPHSYPPMFAGIKFAAILANSIAILTAIIGSGGLGSIIFEGLSNLNTAKILSGSLPTIAIALFIDASFTILERRLTRNRGSDRIQMTIVAGK